MQDQLNFQNHSRYFKECQYVYPVVSRRAQGVSLGVNLNLNNACNWRCVYCQVEGLVRGKPDNVDLKLLEHELRVMLEWMVRGDFIQQFAPVGLQRFNDVCMAGNGEPTLSPQFLAVCELIVNLFHEYELRFVKNLLITNGSQLHLQAVQDGIKLLGANNGEVWFKVDRVASESIAMVNQVNLSVDSISERLKMCGALCPTWIQSCWFVQAGKSPREDEILPFIEFARQHKDYINGVLLYSVARPPALEEGVNVSRVSLDFLASMSKRLEEYGIQCNYYQ